MRVLRAPWTTFLVDTYIVQREHKGIRGRDKNIKLDFAQDGSWIFQPSAQFLQFPLRNEIFPSPPLYIVQCLLLIFIGVNVKKEVIKISIYKYF